MLLLVAEHDRAAAAVKLREVHSSLARLLANRCEDIKFKRHFSWVPTETHGCRIAADRSTLQCESPHGWSAAAPLPTTGCHRWSVQVKKANDGAMLIGVCDEAGRNAWGLNPSYGEVWRAKWTSHTIWSAEQAGGVQYAVYHHPPPPAGFPDANEKRIMLGLRHTFGATPLDAVVDVVYDADAGTLAFGLRYDAWVPTLRQRIQHVVPLGSAVKGFPPGARMRPWVHLCNEGDVVVVRAARAL